MILASRETDERRILPGGTPRKNEPMYEYVRGVLLSNKPGAQAPGSSHPVDRWLVIHTPGGKRLRVFDWLPPAVGSDRLLSEHEGIREGNTYTFILMDLHRDLQKGNHLTHSSVGADWWQGTVIDPAWALPAQVYLAVDPQNIGNLQGILIETAIGQVILSHPRADRNEQGKRLPHALTYQRGEVLCWKHVRLDLLAILA
jgi:hypothetical protein